MEDGGNDGNHVRGRKSEPGLACQEITAKAVDENPCHGSRLSRDPLGYKSGNHAGEHIPHSACGHAGVPRGADKGFSVRAADKGLGAFQDQDTFILPGKPGADPQSVGLDFCIFFFQQALPFHPDGGLRLWGPFWI